MEILKVFAVCLVAAVLIILLRQHREEYAVMAAVAAGVTVLLFLLGQLLPAAGRLRELWNRIGDAADYYEIAFKALGIAWLTAFVADTCRDFGQSSLAAKAELAGRLAIFMLSVPLLTAVLELALEFAGV